jgi:hypothetical protein
MFLPTEEVDRGRCATLVQTIADRQKALTDASEDLLLVTVKMGFEIDH